MAENYYYALGRRKSATARVRVMNGKGSITINGVSAEEYFAGSKMLANELGTQQHSSHLFCKELLLEFHALYRL